MTTNPFRPAEQVAPKVKCLIYGAAGVGKTYLALTAPGRVAVIDTEGGTAFYANRVGPTGLSPFDVLPTKTFAQVEQALVYLRSNPGQYQTLVIDPVTVLYETLQDAASDRRAEVSRSTDADLQMLDWQRIKRAYKRLMTDLVNLPLNVIVTARESDLSEERQDRGRTTRIKIGHKPDAEKSTTYYFDTVIRLVGSEKGRDAIVEKDRTGSHALNARIASPTFPSLFDAALANEGTGERVLQSDAEAARIDAALTMSVEELYDRDETLTPLGRKEVTGTVSKGGGLHSDLVARPTPTGYHIGFRLAMDGGTAVPQVVCDGPIGNALHLSGTDLKGAVVSVEGEAYKVEVSGRRPTQRLIVEAISGDGWRIPAGDLDPAPAADVPAKSTEVAKVADLDDLPF